MDFQEEAIRAFGREICHVVKWWRPAKPAKPANRCPKCGLPFYHIIAHVIECIVESEWRNH